MPKFQAPSEWTCPHWLVMMSFTVVTWLWILSTPYIGFNPAINMPLTGYISCYLPFHSFERTWICITCMSAAIYAALSGPSRVELELPPIIYTSFRVYNACSLFILPLVTIKSNILVDRIFEMNEVLVDLGVNPHVLYRRPWESVSGAFKRCSDVTRLFVRLANDPRCTGEHIDRLEQSLLQDVPSTRSYVQKKYRNFQVQYEDDDEDLDSARLDSVSSPPESEPLYPSEASISSQAASPLSSADPIQDRLDRLARDLMNLANFDYTVGVDLDSPRLTIREIAEVILSPRTDRSPRFKEQQAPIIEEPLTDQMIMETDRVVMETDQVVMETDQKVVKTDRMVMETERSVQVTDADTYDVYVDAQVHALDDFQEILQNIQFEKTDFTAYIRKYQKTGFIANTKTNQTRAYTEETHKKTDFTANIRVNEKTDFTANIKNNEKTDSTANTRYRENRSERKNTEKWTEKEDLLNDDLETLIQEQEKYTEGKTTEGKYTEGRDGEKNYNNEDIREKVHEEVREEDESEEDVQPNEVTTYMTRRAYELAQVRAAMIAGSGMEKSHAKIMAPRFLGKVVSPNDVARSDFVVATRAVKKQVTTFGEKSRELRDTACRDVIDEEPAVGGAAEFADDGISRETMATLKAFESEENALEEGELFVKKFDPDVSGAPFRMCVPSHIEHELDPTLKTLLEGPADLNVYSNGTTPARIPLLCEQGKRSEFVRDATLDQMLAALSVSTDLSVEETLQIFPPDACPITPSLTSTQRLHLQEIQRRYDGPVEFPTPRSLPEGFKLVSAEELRLKFARRNVNGPICGHSRQLGRIYTDSEADRDVDMPRETDGTVPFIPTSIGPRPGLYFDRVRSLPSDSVSNSVAQLGSEFDSASVSELESESEYDFATDDLVVSEFARRYKQGQIKVEYLSEIFELMEELNEQARLSGPCFDSNVEKDRTVCV